MRLANILVKDKSFIAVITVEMIANPEVRLAMLKGLLGEVATKKDLVEQKIELKEEIDSLRRELREFKRDV